MRRRARAIPFDRRRLGALTLDLKLKPAKEWPQHLGLAWDILHGEMHLPDEVVLTVVIAAVSAAQACAQRIKKRVGNIVEFETRIKLGNAFRRLARCAKRAPAKLRSRLDAAVIPLIREGYVDLEAIEAIFDAAVGVFAEFSHQEAAKTALAVLRYQPPGGEQYLTVKNDFQGLSANDRVKLEKALTALGKASTKRKTTFSDIFIALATELQRKKYKKSNSQIHTLIVEYVAAVADIWRRAGLRPSRARHPKDRTYKSRFYRFVDLVLTEMVEPLA